MALIDIKAIRTEARKAINDELATKAKAALVKKYRELSSAEQIVANVKREVADLEQSIEDGSFAG